MIHNKAKKKNISNSPTQGFKTYLLFINIKNDEKI